jgi:hypothetical protein
VSKLGTFYVSIAVREPGDGSNAEIMQIGMWPGTGEGGTPPATMAEAYQCAQRLIDKLPEPEKVVAVRITSFQPGEDDDFMEWKE